MRYAWDEAKRIANLSKHGLVHTETDDEIRTISFRKASKREAAFLIESL